MRLIPQPERIEILNGYSSQKKVTNREICSFFSSDEAYELIVEKDEITVKASSEKGLFYGEKTLKQISLLYDKIPCVKITDKPRFSHRGFMIDCARHMFSLDELKKMISVAADFKFNKFHWHLSDDQGFRIELESFPEITEKGSVRSCDSFINCKSNEKYSGYYKKDEIREIVSFCKELFIDVIPELDMPGHQSALLHVHPEFTCKGEEVEVKTRQGIFKDIICAGNTDAEKCIKIILDEITELFPYDTVHIGGDEVPKANWKACEKCQKIIAENGLSDENELQCLFINKMADYLRNKGKKSIVWNDCLKGKNLSENILIQHWQKDPERTSEAANKGQKVILSPFDPFYVDYPYGMHTLKAGYMFEPDSFRGLTDKGRSNILGVESPIWTEHINNNGRLEYMCFPRWFAVSECGWTRKDNKNYKKFYEVLKKLSVCYRENGLNIAPESEWNPNPAKRLYETVKFFIPKK